MHGKETEHLGSRGNNEYPFVNTLDGESRVTILLPMSGKERKEMASTFIL